MEETYLADTVRERLILAGLSELQERGPSGFSLRRAAARAQVSCAAPYRHFKDKDEYMRQIVLYVQQQWELLSREIRRHFEADPARLAFETCMAALRFRIAHPSVRSVFTLAVEDGERALDEAIENAVRHYAASVGADASATELQIFSARALLLGAMSLIGRGDAEEVLTLTACKLRREFGIG